MNVAQGPMGKIFDILASDLRVLAALTSFVLSLWVVYLDQNINLDGILYFRAAHMILAGDWQGAYHLYSWLFYPALIALVSKTSGLGLEGAAYFLNACFAGLLSSVFISLVQEIGGSRKIIALVAALVIVFYPELNKYNTKVIRGHGYWPFYLWSLLCFIRFYKAPGWRNALCWNVSMIVATLFRIEGLVFAALLPFVLFVQSDCSLGAKVKRLFMAHSVNLALLASLLILQVFRADLMSARTGRLTDVLSSASNLWEGLTIGLFDKAEIVSSMLLNSYSEDYAILVVVLIPVVIFIGKLVDVLTPLLFLLLLCAPFVKCIDSTNKGVRVLLWAGVINVVVVFTFLLPQFFLQGRYVMALALTLLLFLPLVLVVLYEKWQVAKGESRKVWLYYFLALLLFVNAADALVTLPGASSKKYQREAGLWLKENVPLSADIYANNNKILFYSGHIYTHKDNENLVPREDVTNDWLAQGQRGRHDYLALWVRHGKSPGQEEIVAALGTQPLKVFENKRKDKVLVFEGK